MGKLYSVAQQSHGFNGYCQPARLLKSIECLHRRTCHLLPAADQLPISGTGLAQMQSGLLQKLQVPTECLCFYDPFVLAVCLQQGKADVQYLGKHAHSL